jgi:hypothetical protein
MMSRYNRNDPVRCLGNDVSQLGPYPVFQAFRDKGTGNMLTEPLSSKGRPLWLRYLGTPQYLLQFTNQRYIPYAEAKRSLLPTDLFFICHTRPAKRSVDLYTCAYEHWYWVMKRAAENVDGMVYSFLVVYPSQEPKVLMRNSTWSEPRLMQPCTMLHWLRLDAVSLILLESSKQPCTSMSEVAKANQGNAVPKRNLYI